MRNLALQKSKVFSFLKKNLGVNHVLTTLNLQASDIKKTPSNKKKKSQNLVTIVTNNMMICIARFPAVKGRLNVLD